MSGVIAVSPLAVEGLAADSKQRGDLADGAALALELGQNIALKQHAGMSRRTSDLLAVNQKFGSHVSCPRL
jgi:hypothetical protein